MNLLNLDIGPVTLALEFEQKNTVRYFEKYFMSKSSKKKGQIHIQITFADEETSSTVPNSLFLTKKINKNGFETANGLVRGCFDGKCNKWRFIVHPLIVTGDYKRVFEQIFYQAYNHAARNLDTNLVHSSGVIKEGRGYLFVGPSESGKSTVARLSRKYHVINDEINIINLNGKIPMLEGTPFNGLFRKKKPGKAPLKGIFILNQASFHGVERISGGKAIKSLAHEIIPPIGLDEAMSSSLFMYMMDRAQVISHSVPIYRMDFLQNGGFWKIISNL